MYQISYREEKGLQTRVTKVLESSSSGNKVGPGLQRSSHVINSCVRKQFAEQNLVLEIGISVELGGLGVTRGDNKASIK